MVLDLGLLGGWAAGGVAVEAGNMSKSPAGAVDAANADVNALAGAFRQLVDAFAVEPAAAGEPCAAAAPVASDFDADTATAIDVPAGAQVRRFTQPMAPVSSTPEAHEDQPESVAIPFALFAPSFEPRTEKIDIDRTLSPKAANGAVEVEAETESHVDETGQSPIVLTPVPMPMPMPTPTMPQAMPPARIDTNTSSARPAAYECELTVDVAASETARSISGPPQIAPKPAPQAAPAFGPQFASSSAPVDAAVVAAPNQLPVAARAADSIPVDVATVMAAIGAMAPSSGTPRVTATNREPRGNSGNNLNANTKINADTEPGANDADRTLTMLLASQDAVRPAQASPEIVHAASRLAAGLLAAGYTPGAAARKSTSSNSTGAASAIHSPVVVIPFLMPSTTTGFANLASQTNAIDVPMAPADVAHTAPQIIQTIKLAWSRSGGEAHIRLDPRQFGDLSVSIRLDGGQVVARLQADAPAVREWLQTNQRTLQDGLAEHQLKLARLEVVAPGEDAKDPSGKDTREQHDEAQGQRARRPKRQEHGESFEVVA